VILPRFLFAFEFVDGIARVEQQGAAGGRELGYIDSRGTFVWGPFPGP